MTPKIFLPRDQQQFSVDETEWLELPPENVRPFRMQHIPTGMIFALDADLPDEPPPDMQFYPKRDMYAWLTHVCDGAEIPTKEKLIELAQNALALWLMVHGYMGEVTAR